VGARFARVYNLFIIGAGLFVAIGSGRFSKRPGGARWSAPPPRSGDGRRHVGINIPPSRRASLSSAAMLAALGGALGTPVRVVAPGIGAGMIIQAFIITVIGGLGNLKGAFVGAMIVGMLSAYGILLFPVFELFLIFLIMALVLMVKPQGLFGDEA